MQERHRIHQNNCIAQINENTDQVQKQCDDLLSPDLLVGKKIIENLL